MLRWRISVFGATPARSLGVVTAPNEDSAKAKAIEFFSIEPAQQFRVVAIKLGKAKERVE
jgi:hypothetical protein